MKGTEHFKRTIQMYLEQRAAEDALFAKNYRNPAKNIDDCVTYILNYVQRSGCNGFTDGEIFGQAVHYYDENEIEVGKPIQCHVAVNHVVELTAEEKAEARQNAVRQIPRRRTPQVAEPQQAENRHQSDRTRSTTTQPIQFLIMKPRTPIQQEVARLSERLPKLTATQRAYAFRHCFKHYAIKRADGTNICTECGHSWRSEHDLADTVCGCTCPHCGMKLEALRTRKSVFSENEYFCIITTCKQYQVIRFFFVKSRYKAGQAAEYSIYEVVQRWISPKGTTVTVARLRGMSILYMMTYGRNTATWRYARTTNSVHTI